MKISLDRLPGYRLHVFEVALKELSVEELETLAQTLKQGNPRTFKHRADLVRREIDNRRSFFPSLSGIGLIP